MVHDGSRNKSNKKNKNRCPAENCSKDFSQIFPFDKNSLGVICDGAWKLEDRGDIDSEWEVSIVCSEVIASVFFGIWICFNGAYSLGFVV